jgi:hypothetical protein
MILIGCEESQVLCGAFRRAGYVAFSCDLLPTRGNPDWHIQGDVMQAVVSRQWELIVLHPDCTAMAVSGNRWYGRGMPMHERRVDAIAWTLRLWAAAKAQSRHVALENPVSVIFKYLENVQYIQPWQFGHGETKKTGFALHNLPKLTPTNIVAGRENRIWKMAPSPTRKRDRSETYAGIAEAIVSQWRPLTRTGSINKDIEAQAARKLTDVIEDNRRLREALAAMEARAVQAEERLAQVLDRVAKK